jgi:hypothetical protein
MPVGWLVRARITRRLLSRDAHDTVNAASTYQTLRDER